MSLTLLRLPVDLRALARWSAERGFVTARASDEGRALHHLLGESFGAGALQPFRLMPSSSGRANLYAWSRIGAGPLRDLAAAVILPETAAVADPGTLEDREMPGFRAGQRLGFDLLVRPVIRLHADLEGADHHGTAVRLRKGAEVDAFLALALRQEPGVAAISREAVYLDWLAGRLAGADLDRAASRLQRFQRRLVLRGKTAVEGPDAVLHGTLTVTDPETFREGLLRGIGRHCAYGYGMVLLRPPQAPVPRC